MRNQSKPKKKMLSVSNDKKQNRSNSIVALKKPQKILKKNNIVENDIISPKTITYKKGKNKIIKQWKNIQVLIVTLLFTKIVVQKIRTGVVLHQ